MWAVSRLSLDLVSILALDLQLLNNALGAEKKFAPLPAKTPAQLVERVRKALSEGYATISEGLLISSICEEKVGVAQKQKKVSEQLQRLDDMGKSLQHDIRSLVSPHILSKCSKFVLDGSSS